MKSFLIIFYLYHITFEGKSQVLFDKFKKKIAKGNRLENCFQGGSFTLFFNNRYLYPIFLIESRPAIVRIINSYRGRNRIMVGDKLQVALVLIVHLIR